MDEHALISYIAEETGLQWKQVKSTIELLDAENTVAFIARYRKEVTGSLDEENIRNIETRIRYLRNLEERKAAVLKSIDEQGKLTPELEEKIRKAMKLQEVEDLYLPYKPKKRTRATVAREKGLELLAALMLEQSVTEGDRLEEAAKFIDAEKGVETAEDALAGARDIVAETVSENAEVRKMLRDFAEKTGALATEAKDAKNLGVYELYAEFSELVKNIPPHRILAINRGEKEKYLRVSIEVDAQKCIDHIGAEYLTELESLFTGDLKTAIDDAYRRLIAPAIEREIRGQLTARADEHAIEVFAQNLRQLLMAPPISHKKIMGIDPGFRTGCKVAVIDTTGKYLEGDTMYPHEPQKRWDEAKEIVKDLIEDYQVDIIAIGNGTASRETELLVAEIVSEIEREVFYTIVNEAGASVYSASPLARKEFPDLEASMRGNISIARRLLDPLSELVKIDPKSIGVGLYQHDVDQGRLGETLDWVVESCVNRVGVDLNTASTALLRYVAGLNSRIAENIVLFREEHTRFRSREELKNVKALGNKAFEQCAGFLRIADGEVFFDATAVHPESYQAAEKLLELLKLTLAQVKKDGALMRARLKESGKAIAELAQACGVGEETLSDIIDSLEKPGRDPRDQMPKPVLRSDVLKMEDLAEGMILKGTVRNVVDFGAFIDIGVKHDGLVHLSKMAKKYVKNPFNIVSVGDVVEVKVLKVDIERERIALSLVLD